jgi:hypothetical protein
VEGVSIGFSQEEKDIAIGVGRLNGRIVFEDSIGGKTGIEKVLVRLIIEEVERGPMAVREDALAAVTAAGVIINQLSGESWDDVGNVEVNRLIRLFDGID